MVELAVFSIAGEKVRTLAREAHGGGKQRVVWDGRDEQRREVASGVYLYRLRTAELNQAKRMVLLR